MAVENAPTRSRGLLGSMVQLGYPIGNLAAIGALALLCQLPDADFLAWGWRLPFLVSTLLVGVGLYIRMQLEETPVFREIEGKKATARLPLVEVLTEHRRSFFTAVGLKLSEISYVSIAGIFAISYVTGKLAMPRKRDPLPVNAAFDPGCRRRRPVSSTAAASSFAPIARAPSSPRSRDQQSTKNKFAAPRGRGTYPPRLLNRIERASAPSARDKPSSAGPLVS